MNKLLHKMELEWKGKRFQYDFYEGNEIGGLNPITQCQAVCFVDENQVVIFKHVGGYYSLPGGTIEEGESFEEALKREVKEESACEVIDCGLIGYFKSKELPGGEVKYHLRYWAKVRLLDEAVNDPDGKALSREVIDIKEAAHKLNWGERGSILLELAERKYKERL